jgi:hypothetical protein
MDKPTSYIMESHGLTRGPYVITPSEHLPIELTEEEVEDPDAYEARILAEAKKHGITHLVDYEGLLWSLDEWTQHGV